MTILRVITLSRFRFVLWITLCLWTNCLPAQPGSLPEPDLITDRQGLPQGFVAGIIQDCHGFIWMATHDGLCRYDGNQFNVYKEQATGNQNLPFSSVEALQSDQLGRIWITSSQKQLVRLNPPTGQFTDISRLLAGQPFATLEPKAYFADRQNRLWLSYSGAGLVCYDLIKRQYRWFRHSSKDPGSICTDYIRSVLQDKQGNIWVATEAGLERLNEKNGTFTHYGANSTNPLALPEPAVYGLYLRPTGELLLATRHYLCRLNPVTGQFRSYPLPAEGNALWGDHYLWGSRFVTDSRGVVYFDQRDRLFRFTDADGPRLVARFTPQTGFCSSLYIDRSDVLWIGTDGSGVRKYDLRADGFQTARYQEGFHADVFVKWLHMPVSLIGSTKWNDPYKFRYTLDRSGNIWATIGSSAVYQINPVTRQGKRVDLPVTFGAINVPLATDPQGRIWLVHWQNGQHYFWSTDPSRPEWIRSGYQINRKQPVEIIQLVADQYAFWLATVNQGLLRLDRKTGQLREYVHQPDQSSSLSSNELYCMSADPSDPDRLWIGTPGKGLCAFDKRTGRCRRITVQQGLPNDVIYSALPDRHGNLWIGTNKGLCRLNRKTFQTRNYTTEDGLLANEFNRFHYLQLANDQIIMGGVEGITSFQPAFLRDDPYQPRVELTALYINNREVRPGSSSFLRAPVQSVDQLALPYDQNFITIHFAALQFNRSGKNRFRYRLEGVNQDWLDTPRPQAIYTTLAPGHYTFLVNASNTSGIWSPHVRRLGITISPPFWRTWWAYMLYVLAMAGSVRYAIRLRLHQLQLRQSVALRQQEARQLRELDEMKTRFFTNVTHDFRTPLTLILSPLEGLIQDLSGTGYVKRLEVINRNAQQLLGQINQLLDFSKLDAGALTVQEAIGRVDLFVEQVLYLFREEAGRRNISLVYQHSLPDKYWFDAGKLERIVVNLLGNALKFTPSGGIISVSLQAADDILLTVTDTGVGITQENLAYIFDRFFQGHTPSGEVAETGPPAAESHGRTGTGIGLSLVKELVELQGGQITVESRSGEGTTFRIRLPYAKAGEGPGPVAEISKPSTASQAGTTQSVDTDSNGEPVHLLLVEDNPELAEFIAGSLPAHYRISRAANGVEGLQLALAEQPDLVISDVMMPLMDGYTLCQKLKADERTSHIPVILLTARVTLDNRLEGLSRGADDYMTKPFHVSELNLRVRNLLHRMQLLRERMRQQLIEPRFEENRRPTDVEPSGGAHSVAAPSPTDPFLTKVYASLEEKLDDSSLSVEALAAQLNMSRMHLHRKVKALTGLAPNEVIRNYRLKRATAFLREGLNSSETAYRVGFDSPAYFSKCFRELYGKTPLEYAQQA